MDDPSGADREEVAQPNDAADEASLLVIFVLPESETVDMRKDDLEAPNWSLSARSPSFGTVSR
jgi:hypothetical protein